MLTGNLGGIRFLSMTIELTGEAEATVLRMAQESGLTPAQVVTGTLAHFEPMDAEEQALVEQRLDEADRGEVEWISHEEVRRRMGL